jgi:hypothetical protein
MCKTIKKFDESIRGITGRRMLKKRPFLDCAHPQPESSPGSADCTAREVSGIRAYGAR